MEPSLDNRIPRIPGIDCNNLIERIGGDLPLFWDVLGGFASTYRDSPTRIAAALERNPVAARQLAHTLKGVLGNLGAMGPFATCEVLDHAIREGRSELYPALLDSLSREVLAVCDAIAQARAATPERPSPACPAPNLDWLAERYAALRAALERHRARDCKALADEISASALPTMEQRFFADLHALVRSYRFEEAHSMLDRHIDG